MRIASVGHVVFAALMIALGLQGLIAGDFAAIWQPEPQNLPARMVLVYLSNFITLACGIGLLWQRVAIWAARVLLAYLLLWLLMFRGPPIVLAPTAQDSWSGAGETAMLVAGAWIVYAERAGGAGMRIGRLIYGFALIPFGTAHFVFLKQTAALVPLWLPAHTAWAYFTGAAYIAAGLGIIVAIYARLAVALSAIQIALFTVLVWLPIVAAGSADTPTWSETAISLALTAAAWVVAISYRGTPWLAVNRG